MTNYTPSKKIVRFIKGYESLRLTSYLPTPNDRWTIGWGTTFIKNEPVKPGMTITEKEANYYFECDLVKFGLEINRYDIAKNQNEFDALLSLIYNIGVGNFGTSTLLRKLKSDERIAKNPIYDADKQFERWIFQVGKRLVGLERRRLCERLIYKFGIFVYNE